MRILVTGGLGFIGSHTVVELINNGYEVVILDNLSNCDYISVTAGICKLTDTLPYIYIGDVCSKSDVSKVFSEFKIDGVIHFAAMKHVDESIELPINYYHNNLTGLTNLLTCMSEFGCKNLIYSSSATVYGYSEEYPFTEDNGIESATNPYGMTKCIGEVILNDVHYAHRDWNIIKLRYFNPVGAHPSGLLGESPKGTPSNLMPVIVDSVAKSKSLKVFGTNYNTADGTCERDFIHVLDVAAAHVKSISKFSGSGCNEEYNVGTGVPTSVLKLINTFKEVNKVSVKFTLEGRRPGDVAISYCDPSKIKHEIGWAAQLTIEDMCRDAWNFYKVNHEDR